MKECEHSSLECVNGAIVIGVRTLECGCAAIQSVFCSLSCKGVTGMQLPAWAVPGWLLGSKWSPAARGLCFAVPALCAVESTSQRVGMQKAVDECVCVQWKGWLQPRREVLIHQGHLLVCSGQGSCTGREGEVFVLSHLGFNLSVHTYCLKTDSECLTSPCPYWISRGDGDSGLVKPVWTADSCHLINDLAWLNKMVSWFRWGF